MHLVLISIVLTFVGYLLFILAQHYVPLGEGPDEMSHIDYTRFLIDHSVSEIDVRAGLATPHKAPLGQGHQPPLAYLFGGQLLRAFYDTSALGQMVDYSAGITYSSAGRLFGGTSLCSYGIDSSRTDPKTVSARAMLVFLRHWNVLLLLVSIVMTYIAGRLLFDRSIALMASLLQAAIPTAMYRSIFVSNDNFTATLASLAFVLACLLASSSKRKHLPLIAACTGIVCGLAFLSKYSGIITIVFAPLLLISLQPFDLKKWIWTNLIIVLSFSITVFWDLYLNLTVDGDMFSNSVLREVVPFLYRPSSFWDVVTSSTFIPTVYKRYWINFHILGPGLADGTLPLWLLPSWYVISITSSLGLIFIFRAREGAMKAASLIAILIGMLTLIVVFATKYPLPAGRYLHTIVTPFSILLALGLNGLFSSHRARLAYSITVTALVFLVFSTTFFTFNRLKGEFKRCKDIDLPYTTGGMAAQLGDIDGDGDRDIFLFHRIRNRLFVAENRNGQYSFQPAWTRLAGLVADEFEVADLNGDGLAEPVFRRVGSSLWYAIDSRSIVEKRPAKTISFQSKFTPDSQALVADLNNDNKADLSLYFPNLGRWKVYNSIKLQGRFRRSASPQMLTAPKGGKAFILRNINTSYITIYDAPKRSLSIRSTSGTDWYSIGLDSSFDRILPLTFPSRENLGFAALSGKNFCLTHFPWPKIEEQSEQTMNHHCIELPFPAIELSESQLLVDSIDQSSINIIIYNKRVSTFRSLRLSIRKTQIVLENIKNLVF